VTLIKAAVQKKWGSEYTLVTGDGIELEESPETESELAAHMYLCIHWHAII